MPYLPEIVNNISKLECIKARFEYYIGHAREQEAMEQT